MKPGVAVIYCPQGATFHQDFLYKRNRKPQDLTGYTARMQVRETHESSTVLAEMTTENGGITLGGAEGTISLYLNDTQTQTLKPGVLVYDLELIDDEGDVTRLLEGEFTVSPNVTR